MSKNNSNKDPTLFPSLKSNNSNLNESSQISSNLSTSNNLKTSTRFNNSNSKPLRKKVLDLKCSEIRWFYKKENDSKWSLFTGLFFIF